MEKKNFIVYNYKQRDDVISKHIHDALSDAYAYSYPRPVVSYDDMLAKIVKARKESGNEYDKNFRLTYCDGKYCYPTDFYYIPQKVLKDVWDSYTEACGGDRTWKEYIGALHGFLFEKSGFYEVYSPTEYSQGKDVRHYEDLPLLKDVIGEESAEKVNDLITKYRNTYRWGEDVERAFGWAFLATPTHNRETVKNAWKEAFGIDIEIPDDDAWIDEYTKAELDEDEEYAEE